MKLDMAIESEHAEHTLALQGAPLRWKGSALSSECTLHQISPYIGKTKSSIARGLIEHFTISGQTVLDPFCGCGTIALEAWLAGRNCIATDLSPYAHLLTVAKLSPPATLEQAMRQLQLRQRTSRMPRAQLICVPFHNGFVHSSILTH